MRIATHDQRFHADDLFAVVILEGLFGDDCSVEVLRSRETHKLIRADFRIDVGGRYKPGDGDFDHHQDNAPKRQNGEPYAAAGLVWDVFGFRLVKHIRPDLNEHQVAEIAQDMDRFLFRPLDLADNGMTPDIVEREAYTLVHMVDALNPAGFSVTDEERDMAFHNALNIAWNVILSEIQHSADRVLARGLVKEALARRKDNRIVVLEKCVPWQQTVCKDPDALYVVFPEVGGENWRVQAVPPQPGSFDKRKPLPAEWGGLNGDDLVLRTEVSDAVFCHKNLFIAGAKTREGATALARLAMDS